MSLQPLYELAIECGRCKKKKETPEYSVFCGTCCQIAYCSKQCQQDHFGTHSPVCVPITAQQLSELTGFCGWEGADTESIEAEEIAARGRPGGGFRGGRSSSPRLSPTRRGFSPTRRAVSPRRLSPTRRSSIPRRPGSIRPRWDPYRRFLPGILPPAWSLLPNALLWAPWYDRWYRGGLPLFGIPGLPVLPYWPWVDDPVAVAAQLAILQATYSFPGAYIAPDPVNRRFIWVRA